MKKDHIEEVYSELEMFSKEPPKELWDNIEARLHPKKKKRRILVLWGSAAAVLVMLVGYVVTSSPAPNTKPIKEITDIEQNKVDDMISELEIENTKIVDEAFINKTNKDSVSEKQNTKDELLNNEVTQKQLADRSSIKNKEKVRDNSTRPVNKKTINDNKEISKYNQSYAQNSKVKKNAEVINKAVSILENEDANTVNHEKEKVLASNDSISNIKEVFPFVLTEELLAENKMISDSIKPRTKWSVEVLGGLSNTASEASIQGTPVSTTPQNDFVYTLKIGYAISDKLVVKSGIGKNVLGQKINNVQYVSTDVSLTNNDSQNIINNEAILFLASQEAINDFSTSGQIANEGDLQQQFDYIQVPLEVSYNVLRAQKFNVSLGIGGNINFLTNNRAFLDNEQIGESLGADATVFGATMNSNISFKLAKKTILFLEPSYNYFEKPIDNNNQAFNNTQLRVLFGLRYKL